MAASAFCALKDAFPNDTPNRIAPSDHHIPNLNLVDGNNNLSFSSPNRRHPGS
jgi:hypothetical protein